MTGPDPSVAAPPESRPDDDLVVPLWKERAVVGKREVVTARVQVSTRVEEHDETVQAELAREGVEVVRVPFDIELDTAPAGGRAGATLILRVVEERLVIVKRYLLKEEVHITATATVETVEEVVRLRSMHADVRRSPLDPETQT